MDAHVTFYGQVVAAGKSITIAADFEDEEFETIHFTQVALGPKPAKGPHTIFIENEDGKFAVGTLDREKCTQFSMDITIACDDVTISHTGESDVHITGYRTIALLGYEDEDLLEEDGEEDGARLYRQRGSESSDEDDEEESSEEDEPPRAVPLQKKKISKQLIHDEASDDSGSEEESGGEDEDDSSEEDSENSEEEDSEEEEEEAPPAKKEKRKQPAAQTPQPAKKAKAADVKKAPATAPAKGTTPAAASPADEKQFTASLKSFLQKNGPCKLSVLGSTVKRPPSTPKFKTFIEQNSDIFSFNAVTQTVSLNSN